MLVLCMSWLYTLRLIFWGRVPSHYQNLVRTILSVFIAAGLPLALVTILLAVTSGKAQSDDQTGSTIMIAIFTIIGVLCQVSTVIWLLRYRKE